MNTTRTAHQRETMESVAMEFRDAIQDKNFERLQACFADDCELEMFGYKLQGKPGVKKWFAWMYSHMKSMRFERISALSDGDIYIEEYILHGVIHTGGKVRSRQSRTLVFEDGKVKEFRLYMDRLQFAESVAGDFASKMIIKKFEKTSIKEML